MTRIDAALVALTEAQDAVREASAALRQAEVLEIECQAQYAKARPLTDAEREELAVRVAAGDGLCCGDGLAWLRERLPDPWAFAINAWAYSALGCRGQAPWLEENAARVRGLELDRFPP
jgi:hypothetical protein